MKTIFVDVDTQLDFIFPAGALYAPGAENITETLRRLTYYASQSDIKIISTADAHSENDVEFKVWKPHCVAGTTGQLKLTATIVGKPYVLSSREGALELPAASRAQQIVVEKQNVNCFTNPNLVPLLKTFEPSRFVVYGVVTEVCVLHAAEGLLNAGYDVDLVSDAIWPFAPNAADLAIKQLLARGARLTSTAEIGA
jgi:nicotinamidase/pyrazinamidase